MKNRKLIIGSRLVVLSSVVAGILLLSGLLLVFRSLRIIDPSNVFLLSIIVGPNDDFLILGAGLALLFTPLLVWLFARDSIREEIKLREEAESATRREEVARKKEAKAKAESLTLQDILAHDIRNYNQVAKLSTELLREKLKDDEETETLLDNLIKSIDGSTALVFKARTLGKVLNDQSVKLRQTNVARSIETAMMLVTNANPEKRIVWERKLKSGVAQGSGAAYVLADDLLDQVFVNLFTNSVRHRDGNDVHIETRLETEDTSGRPSSFWKISVADDGRGIPDELKEKVFTRYLAGARGSGLGMSIVHALVVERYNGKIQVRNRVPDDYAKGTLFEILLPKAPDSLTTKQKDSVSGLP